jgi:hypothetical protein
MKHIWTITTLLFQRHPADSRIRLAQGYLAGICGLLALGLSTSLVWPDDRLVFTLGGGIILLLTSLTRFLPRYRLWFEVGRAATAAATMLILYIMAWPMR